MKRNRFVAVVLSLVLLVSLIGGCTDNSTADSKSKPTNSAQSKPVSSVQSEVIGDTPNEPTSSAPVETSSSASSKPSSSTQSKPTSSTQSKPSSNAQSKPTNISSSKPSSNTQSKPSNTTIPITDVSIFGDDNYIAKGSTVKIHTYIEPDNATEKLKWSSSNKSVATVKNGIVTAVGNGTATISATAPNGKSATCDISVYTPATGISLSQKSYTVYKGKSVSINAAVVPADASDKILLWSSSDPSIVKVGNGFATGVSNGTATITITTLDGKITQQCTVTVAGDAPLSAKYNIMHVQYIDGWQEGLKASVEVYDGSKNYSDYTFNISIYHEDGRLVASGNNIKGHTFNTGWIASLTVTLREITGPNYKVDPKPHKGKYTAVFEIIDDKGKSYSGTTTYVW